MRQVAIHLRVTDTLQEVAEKALRLQLPFFQCFMIDQNSGRLLNLTDEQIQQFLELRRAHFKDLFVHASYWMNLSSVTQTRHYAMERELVLARKLEFTHIIFHPGSAKGAQTREEGIDALARTLNDICEREKVLTYVLENTTHGGFSIGGDFKDFALLLTKLTHPERIKFCIDTSHAHAFGYDIITPDGQAAFITLLETTIGFDSIALIHLNDTQEKRGSKIDKHAVIGEGKLTPASLQSFINHPSLKHIPIVMELPPVPEDQELKIIEWVRGW